MNPWLNLGATIIVIYRIFEPILLESSDYTTFQCFLKLRVSIIRGASPPGPPLISEHVRLGIKKKVRAEGKIPFYSSAIFSSAFFF